MIKDTTKPKFRKLTTDERKATDKAIQTTKDTIDLINYNLQVRELALSKGIDYKAKAEKQQARMQVEELNKQLGHTEGILKKLNTDISVGVEIKEKIDFSKIQFDAEKMKEFIKELGLEREYLLYIETEKDNKGVK